MSHHKKKTMLVQLIDVPKEELDDYREAFNLFDKRGKGTITPHDIWKILKNFGNPIPEEQIKDLVKKIDTSGDGEIDFGEFVSLMKEIECADDNSIDLEADDIIKAFEMFDKKKKGKITMQELKIIMVNMGGEFNDEEFKIFLKDSGLKENENSVDYKKLVEKWKNM